MLTTFNRLLLVSLALMAMACSSNSDEILINEEENQQQDDAVEQEETEQEPEFNGDTPNILFLLADDMGLDASPGYDIGTLKPQMPNVQNLINSGIRFNNVWSNPTCTPTRAGILTGKYPIRTGV